MTTQDPIELLNQMNISFVPQNFVFNAGNGNNITAIELFLKAGMNVNTQYGGSTALYAACQAGNEEIVKLLISNGANINVANAFEDKYSNSGFTSLMQAVESKHYNIINILLENKANFEIKKNSANAMSLAIKAKDTEAIELLKKYGAVEPSKEEIEKTKKEEKKDTIKAVKKLSIIAGVCILLIGGCVHLVNQYGGSSSSSSGNYSSSTKTHKCIWCGKEYTGAGYYHIEDQCASTDADYDQCCSEKCCQEQWNSTHH